MSIGSWTFPWKPLQQLSVTRVGWCSRVPALLLPPEDWIINKHAVLQLRCVCNLLDARVSAHSFFLGLVCFILPIVVSWAFLLSCDSIMNLWYEFLEQETVRRNYRECSYPCPLGKYSFLRKEWHLFCFGRCCLIKWKWNWFLVLQVARSSL